MAPLSIWYRVTFDDTHVYRDVRPPGSAAWSDSWAWAEVIRVCFEPGDFLVTDTLYIFTHQRPASYEIPAEAEGGAELWGEIVRRGLFDAQLAIAVASGHSGLACWPEN
jgi:hypothetical protein